MYNMHPNKNKLLLVTFILHRRFTVREAG